MEIPLATGWLLGACMEARGKQDLWLRQKPEVLEALREQAIVQSVESSNRIEGVTVSTERLRPLILGKTNPRSRPEEEVFGYRRALDWIFRRKHPIDMRPEVILRLHQISQKGMTSDAGRWKAKDHEIIEFLPNGERRIRFRPTKASETPSAIGALCNAHEVLMDSGEVPPLIAISTFVFDFLCIHPFRDGNGRVSRLLTTLLLEGQNFRVARYISLERLMEETKEEYYKILNDCSQEWHEGTNIIAPWWNYFLTILKRAYQGLEQQMERLDARPAKRDLVRQIILDQLDSFTLAEICAMSPMASEALVKKALGELKHEGLVTLTGRGRGARWKVKR